MISVGRRTRDSRGSGRLLRPSGRVHTSTLRHIHQRLSRARRVVSVQPATLTDGHPYSEKLGLRRRLPPLAAVPQEPVSTHVHAVIGAFQPPDTRRHGAAARPFAFLQSPHRELQSRRSQRRLHFCHEQSGARPVGAEPTPDTDRLLTQRGFGTLAVSSPAIPLCLARIRVCATMQDSLYTPPT